MTNIALVVLDTLRKDAFDRYFGWMPGLHFENAYSTANWTIPSHASLFTGQYASEIGVHAKNMHLDCRSPTLAEQLRAVDYTTRGFSANPSVTGTFSFDRGFDDFRSPKQIGYLNDDSVFDFSKFGQETDTEGIGYYFRLLYEIMTDDSAILPSVVALARKAKEENNGVRYGGLIEAQNELSSIEFSEREFFFLNVMEAHELYRVPPEYQTVEEPDYNDSVGDISFGSENTKRTKQAYDDCARYLSEKYREVFDELRETFDYVITLADHGELLGESGAWGHEHGIHPALTHVPLVISGDGLDGECTETVSLLDVHATILDIAEAENNSRGRTLLGGVESRESLTEYLGLTSWSEENLIQNGYEDCCEQYDRTLRGYASSGGNYGYETPEGFVTTGMTKINDPEQQLAKLIEDLDTREVEADNEVPEEIKNQLEHLGYA